MSFQQGLSGLNAAAKSLDVIGNNIANASTVGFKGSTTQFADVYANALNGAGGLSAGIGVKTAAIAQQFTQGNVEASSNPLDIAINGAGFFRIEQAGVVQYSRNGQFSLDKEGFIVNAQGAKLTGYGLGANGLLAAGTAVPLKIDTADQPPKVTSEVQIQLQLDSRASPPKKTEFDPADPDTYNKQVPMSVYDTLGNSHTLSTFYVKSPTGDGTWNVYAAKDGTEIGALDAVGKAQTDPAAVASRGAWDTASKVVPPVAATLATAIGTYATDAANAVATGAGNLATADNLAEVRAAAAAAAAIPGATPVQIDAAIAKALKMEPKSIGTLKFDTNGALNLASTGTAGKFNIDIPIVPSTGAELNLPVEINFAGTTSMAPPPAKSSWRRMATSRVRCSASPPAPTAASWASTAMARPRSWVRSCLPTSPTRTACSRWATTPGPNRPIPASR